MNIISKIKKVVKTLPKPMRNLIVVLYRQFNSMVKLDRVLAGQMAEYFHLSLKEVIWLFKSSERVGADLWHILNPKTEEEIQSFYKTTPFYVFELAYWHMTRFQRKFRSEIIGLGKGEVLDFGGGLGDLCVALAERGLDVDYADVSGITFNFAKWLFQKCGQKINMLDLSKENISKQYDAIYCIDVIEHVLNPKQILRDFSAHLKRDGKLIITNLKVDEILDSHPMHLKTDLDSEEFLNQLGFAKSDKPWLWIKS